MKRVYKVRVEKGENFDAWEYNVVATHGQEAAVKAMRQARKDSGIKGGWRVKNVNELPDQVIP